MSALRDEWGIVSREPAFRWASLLLILVAIFCVWNGGRFAEERFDQARAEEQRSLDKRAADKDIIRKETAGEIPVNPWGPSEPTKADWNAARPPGPLAMLSFGREDVEPMSGKVSLWMTRTDNLFRKYQFGSPVALAAGRFDAGFLIILLLPLFILALGYNLVSQERESGRLRLSRIQSSEIGRRLFVRLLIRLSPVYALLPIFFLAGLVYGLPVGRLALWVGAGFLYLAIWTGVVALIALIRRRSETLALFAAGIWLAIVLLIPATGSGIAQASAPPPSSFEIINGARSAEVKANRRLAENLETYVSDHPELMTGGPTQDDWAARLYVSQLIVEKDVAPILASHRDLAATRDRSADFLRFASPTTVVDELLADIAGTGGERQRAYEEQVAQFLLGWRARLSPMIFKRERLTAAQIDALPRFEFVEPTLSAKRTAWSFAYLLALAVVLMSVAYRFYSGARFQRAE